MWFNTGLCTIFASWKNWVKSRSRFEWVTILQKIVEFPQMWTRVHIFNFCEKKYFWPKFGFFSIFGHFVHKIVISLYKCPNVAKNRKNPIFWSKIFFSQKLKIWTLVHIWGNSKIFWRVETDSNLNRDLTQIFQLAKIVHKPVLKSHIQNLLCALKWLYLETHICDK